MTLAREPSDEARFRRRPALPEPGEAADNDAVFDSDRYPHLARIDSPADLRRCDEAELPALADELRAYLIESVSNSGGHFAANLGVVELTLALHYLFDTPRDRLVWDVGHQCYAHKILSGRRDRIGTIKQLGGLAPFPSRAESEHDCFGVGHSSTSISAALGMALVAGRRDDAGRILAVIGDGAMTAGQAFEALNHAGASGADLLVVLNDNQMSIGASVGGLTSEHPRDIDGARVSVPAELFEKLGFHYAGPIDGHDLPSLLAALRAIGARRGPRLLHVRTIKGRGYAPAERAQTAWHAVGPFDPASGRARSAQSGGPSYTDVFADWVCDMARADERLYAITPAMREGSGLLRFSQEYPARFCDVGIAEQHAVTLAAGMACAGAKPVVAIYSTFLQRGYDQLIHDVALQNLDVTFAIDRAGLVGPDGATHAGSFDLSYLRTVPNLLLMVPADAAECRRMLTTGFRYQGPAAIRYPRDAAADPRPEAGLEPLEIGCAEVRRRGRGVVLLAFGAMLAIAAPVAERLDASLVNMRFVKPLDEALLAELARTHAALVTLEDGALLGGAGSAVGEWMAAQGIELPLLAIGLPDRFPAHATRSQQLAAAGLDAVGVETRVRQRFAALLASPTLRSVG